MYVPGKSRFKENKTQTKPLRRLFIGAFIGFLLVSCPFVYYLSTLSHPFPIRYVDFEGDHPHVVHETLYQSISKEVKKGFFASSVGIIKRNICYQPWIKDAIVRRVWPDRLVIKVFEHKPLAIWNDHAIITQNDALILPDEVNSNEPFPRLYGPDGKYQQIVDQWRKMGETLEKIDLKIDHLELAPRGAWQLTLSDGIQVKLGTHDVTNRLERFVRAYIRVLKEKESDIAYVDLRYTLGLAVGWIDKSHQKV